MERTWECGGYDLRLGLRTVVMGVVNLDPDSFSGDAVSGEAAFEHAMGLIAAGAGILDIGGESTRPGAPPVPTEVELDRVIPLVSRLRGEVSVPLCIDTTKAAVARAALYNGANIINDISAGTFDAEMFDVLSEQDCGCVLMHLRGTPTTMGWSRRHDGAGGDVIAEVRDFLGRRVAAAIEAGIMPQRIALDPGFGFGKSVGENLELIARGRELTSLGYPLLIGTSRKSTIGKLLGDATPQERAWGTAATIALAIGEGYDIVRVHDVREMAQVARVADAVIRRAVA